MNFPCQSYREVSTPDEILAQNLDPSDNFLQLKQDGIWARIVIKDGMVSIFSKTDQFKKSFPLTTQPILPRGTVVLVGEFMYGSQWSKQQDRSGRLYIFDCVVADGDDISHLPYKDRYRWAGAYCVDFGQPFEVVPCYSLSKLGDFWHTLAETHEGFIIRKWSSTYYTELVKLKFEVEDDFVVMGIIEGQGKHLGRMGALMLGQYDNGRLEHVMDCGGGFSDEQRVWWRENYHVSLSEQSKVVQIKAKGRFAGGALRHPCFVRIRDDKLPSQCTLKRQSK